MSISNARLLLGGIVILLCLVLWLALAPYTAGAASKISIPASFGPCKGALGDMLIFEDSSGTVRLVRTSGTVYMTINRRG